MAKLWVFYKVQERGDKRYADVYAISDNPIRAAGFKEMRKGLICIEKNMSKEDIKRAKDAYKSNWIIEDELHTRDTTNENCKYKDVAVLLTEKEAVDIKLHIDGFVLFIFGSLSLNPRLFSEEIRDALYLIGMADAYHFSQRIESIPDAFQGEFMANFWREGSYVVDELAVFLQMVKDTFDNLDKEETKNEI